MMLRHSVLLLVLVFAGACSQPSFHIPAKEYRGRVQTLGVLPLLVDTGSDIHHPRSEQVMELLRRENEAATPRLVEMLRSQKGYFDVRLMGEAPQGVFDELIGSSTVAGVGDTLHLEYGFRSDTASQLASAHGVDAMLVVVLHGVVRTERRWDRAALSVTYLDTPVNLVTVSACVVDPAGQVLWQLPAEKAGVLLDLQYPDFDEAYYNRSDQVPMKYLRIEGLDKTLAERSEKALPDETLGKPYWSLLRRIVADLDPGRPGLFR